MECESGESIACLKSGIEFPERSVGGGVRTRDFLCRRHQKASGCSKGSRWIECGCGAACRVVCDGSEGKEDQEDVR